MDTYQVLLVSICFLPGASTNKTKTNLVRFLIISGSLIKLLFFLFVFGLKNIYINRREKRESG